MVYYKLEGTSTNIPLHYIVTVIDNASETSHSKKEFNRWVVRAEIMICLGVLKGKIQTA